MITLWSRIKKWVRPVRLAQLKRLPSLSLSKLTRWSWSAPLSNMNSLWSGLKKTQKKRNASNRRPKLVIRNNLVTKQFFLRTILSLPPLNESWQQTFNVMRLFKSLPNKSSLRKCQLSQLKHKVNVSSEESRNGPKPIACLTTTNSPGFTSSTTPGKWPKPSFAKHRKSMRSAAPPWQRKNSISIAFSKISAPMMIWQSAKTDQSHNTSL